ncbi:MAG: M16 family metallopeptidase [Sandaracinaceae bacterium]
MTDPMRWMVRGALLAGALAIGPVAGAQTEGEQSAGSAAPTGSMEWLEVRRERLANGLRVVLAPDRSLPTVGIAVYYDVGSRNEIRGASGFAHLFEHMMFQGSANVAKGEHFSLIMNRGGSMNGTTSPDRTNYYETLPANELALGLWLEADRMKSLAVTEENFENQRAVVIQEYQQSYGNRPYALSWLRIDELAYGDYWPYAHSTIGDLQDLESAPLSAVQQFWMDYYAPNNAVLTVAGDFDPDEALAMVQRYFGSIPARSVPPYEPPELLPQTSERADTILDPLAERPAFHLAWHIPPFRDEGHYALELLGLILGDGESSRLYQELVKERELLTEVSVFTDDRRGPDLFRVWGIVAEGASAEDARERIYRQVANVGRNGVTRRELEKARNRLRSVFVFGLQSNLQRAQILSEFEMYFGDATLLGTELDRYLAVTADDIQEAARRYLTETNQTVLDVVPQPAEDEGEG